MRVRGLVLALLAQLCTAAFPPQSTNVQVWPCSTGSDRQAWTVQSGTSPDAIIKLGDSGGQPNSNLVLNTLGYVNASGGTLNVWTYAPNTPWGQQWTFDAARGEVRSLTNGLCAGTANASSGQPLPAGTTVVQVPCSGVAEARWTHDAATAHFVWASDTSLCLDAGTAASCAEPPLSSLPFCNTALTADDRVADLVPRLQPVEAASMLSVSNNGVPRLGIPPLRFGEALHGVLSGCGAPYTDPATGYTSTGCPTSFPTGLALGATFNRTLWSEIGRTIGTEARALFNQGFIAQSVLFTPDINPFRDPRWGRGMEVPSEDPVVCAEYAAAYVDAFQGGGDASFVLSVASPKHAFAYDQEGNSGPHDRTHFCAPITRAAMTEYFLPPFYAALVRGKAGAMMCAASGYGLDGAPGAASCAHADFNIGVLREEWGWDGIQDTDGNGVGYLWQSYGSGALNCGPGATGPTNACRAGLRGGVDIELGETLNTYALAAIADGNITQADVDTAITRSLRALFRLGLVDPPATVPWTALGPADVDTAAHRALSLEAARQSVVLLRNSAGLLPLSLSKGMKLAVIGPNANASDALLANYHGGNTLVASHTPLLALTARAAAAGAAVTYAPGCATVLCTDDSGFAAAAATAAAADVVVFIGGNAPWRGGAGAFNASEGEEFDRTNLTMAGLSEALITAVLSAGKPVVVVLLRGGPIAMSPALRGDARLATLIDLLYPGELGGEALADVLTGAFAPVGRLPTTTYPPEFVDSRSIVDYDFASGQGVTHLYYSGEAQEVFGAGLSYTNFSLAWLSSPHVRAEATAWAPPPYAVNVTNVGSVASGVTVLAFVDPDAGPRQRLFDFQGAALLAPGASTTLIFSIPPAAAARVDARGEAALHPTTLRVRIGMPGQTMLEGSVEIVLPAGGQPVVISKALP